MTRKKKVGDMLVEAGVISEEQLQEALEQQKSAEEKQKIGHILVEKGYLTEKVMAQTLASQLGLEFVSLQGIRINDDVKNLVPVSILKKYCMIPLNYSSVDVNRVRVAMVDPMDIRANDDFYMITSRMIEPVIALESEILKELEEKFGDNAAMLAARRYEEEQQEEDEEGDEAASESGDVENSPLVQLVNLIVEQACRQRASDIHIEPLEDKVRVRFRIDGSLYQKYVYEKHMLAAIIARIKIIGGMDISEKRKPQDGRSTHVVDGQEYDIRISILPTVYGEKCVMRLAEKKLQKRGKEQLGMRPKQLERFDSILANPNGIILVTGPTGSGKSTTLYTALSEMNNEDINIITVEDPVEVKIEGVNQVNVNTKTDLTFANALRSILRQDPDVIMIGEIRDTETAKIAVQASITGHLVVSTLHTNSSASTITRMMDMGVESYLLADSLVGIIAQRLVRRLCEKCKQPYMATPEELKYMGIAPDKEVTMYKPCGCPECNQTGYKGRVGVYEIMQITPAIKKLIVRQANSEEIKVTAQKEGMATLHRSASMLAVEGKTSFGEILKVSMED